MVILPESKEVSEPNNRLNNAISQTTKVQNMGL